MTQKALHPTCTHVLSKEEARDALSRVLRVCRESGYRKLGIPKRIYENRELVRCLYEQHMALGQSFIIFINMAESSRMFFNAIVDALKETFPDVDKFHWDIVDDKSGSSLPEDRLVIKCLDGLIAVCGTSGEKLAKLQTENRDIAYLLKNNPAFSERLGFIKSWLEDHELFFEDMRHALQGIFKKLSGDAALPSYGWVGNELTEYQIQFGAGKLPKSYDSVRIDPHESIIETCKKLRMDSQLKSHFQKIEDGHGDFIGIIAYYRHLEGFSEIPFIDKVFNNILFRFGIICIICYHMFYFIYNI